MKKLLLTMVLTLVVPAAIVAADVEISGDVTPGMQQVDVDSNSSKFNEYRDLRDGFYLYHFGFEALDTEKGRFLEMQGRSLLRDDQNIRIRAGQHGRYRVTFEWDEIPHRLSNGAETPFLNRGGGLFEVPATIPEIHPAFSRFTQPASNGSEKVLNTGGVGRTNAQDAADLVASDSLAAEYLDRFLHPTRLRNEREKGKLTFDYTPRKDLAFRLSLVNEDRSGNQIGYGPIGDRPPRSLNVQFVEPIDYRTQELKLTGDYVRKTYQVNLSYQLSLFENDVDFLTWQNMFVEAPEGSTFETWDRAIGAFGRRPLPQDNRYHNALLTFGLNLPLASRLVATGSWARMEQDEDLSPYSFNGVVDGASPAIDPRAGLAWNDPSKLVRDSADASIDNTMFNVDYVINPIQRLNLRAFFRFYGLDNDTPTDDWRYVTQDTTNTNGTVNFKNKRRNLAFAFDRKNYGVASTYSLAFWRTTLGLDYEREEIDRDFREADTDENIYKASLRSRPASWVMLGARYRYGDREGDGYNGRVTQQSYWYDPSVDTVDNDNPRFTFTNHPDARRYDVSDRERNLAHFLATFTVLENLALSGTYRYRNDDFDSDVRPTQPLAGSGLPDEARFTPGDQIGLLEDERHQIGLDAAYAPIERLTLSLFGGWEDGESQQRGIEFNENNKQDPSTVDAAELGPWDRRSSQWFATIGDRTATFGVGAGYVIIPEKINFTVDYFLSRGKVDIDYSGFGARSSLPPFAPFADNSQFAFRSPPDVEQNRHTLNATLDYRLIERLSFAVGYMFERYELEDWQQAANTPWFESVDGNENLLRDTSRSHQWGNRLPNLGSFLAPTYNAHLGFVSMTLKF